MENYECLFKTLQMKSYKLWLSDPFNLLPIKSATNDLHRPTTQGNMSEISPGQTFPKSSLCIKQFLKKKKKLSLPKVLHKSKTKWSHKTDVLILIK